MEYETLIYELLANGVARITMNRPRVRNALNRELMQELSSAFDQADTDPAVRAVVLAGAGTSFCAGFDLKQEAGEGTHPPEVWIERFRADFACFYKIWQSTKPYVAAIQGHCIAGATELALLCDLAIAADDAVFGTPEVRHASGIGPGILLWVVGMRAAKHLLLLGDSIDAAEAQRIGLVTQVVPLAQLPDRAVALAGRLALMPPNTMKLNKRTINEHYDHLGMRQMVAYNLALATLINATDEALNWERLRQTMEFKEFVRLRDNPYNPGT